MTATNGRCVLLFTRSPELEGKAKGLFEERAVFEIARRRVASAAATLPDVALVVAGGGPAPAGSRRLAQRGGCFGERLEHALEDARSLGYTSVVVVPSDVPALSAAHLAAAFDALALGATPLGPSPDGGVYLIGVDTRALAPFSGVRWRTAHVLADLLALLARRGSRAVLLAPLRDVDAPRDLAALARERLDPELDRLLRALLARVPERPDRRSATPFPAAARSSAPRAPPALAA